ncbi:helicase-related protein, partial [Treponema sp. R6D11]
RERFALPKNDPRAFDILLFTEVGSEGLDYQFCDTIVNYDLPWNPMRIEQRIGRIDRRGQKSDVAHIYNCITKDTIDEEIYERCLKRIGIFENSIGDCSEILGELARSIEEIILDPILTKEERESRLEQLADN